MVSVAINIPISQSRKESRRSWIGFANAFTLSLETIFIESLTIFLGIPPITLAATSIPMAGVMLLFIVVFGMKRKLTIFRSCKYLLPGSAFIAIGIITWYDSVSRIGAAKESVLFGPIGTLAVLFLARFFLHERLSTLQLVGVIIAIFGFFLSVASAAVGSPLSWFSLGDLEVILSGIAFAAAIIYLTKLTRIHSSIEVAGASLLISGVILAAFQWIYSPVVPSLNDWLFLSLYSLFPLIGALLYSISLAKLGASLTSTFESSANLMTIVLLLILREFGYRSIFPENIPVLVLGGIFGVVGISLIHLNDVTLFRRAFIEFCKRSSLHQRKTLLSLVPSRQGNHITVGHSLR